MVPLAGFYVLLALMVVCMPKDEPAGRVGREWWEIGVRRYRGPCKLPFFNEIPFVVPLPLTSDMHIMQTKLHSIVEACANTFIGYVINLLVQLMVYPLFGARFTFSQNLEIGLIFMVVSLTRGYVLRRYFNRKTTMTRGVVGAKLFSVNGARKDRGPLFQKLASGSEREQGRRS